MLRQKARLQNREHLKISNAKIYDRKIGLSSLYFGKEPHNGSTFFVIVVEYNGI